MGTNPTLIDNLAAAREPDALKRARASGKHTRIFCDNCQSCIERQCDGSTARHHFIHIFHEGNPESERMLRSSGFPEYSNGNSGL